MNGTVRTEQRSTTSGLDGTVYLLEVGSSRAEIWPALGGNCYRWQVEGAGSRLDLLYAAPDLFADGRPTRSGIPVLFPFPNRIRDGAFTWEGKEYRLPQNDPAKKNAIHGFACRKPWRVLDQGSAAGSAWLRLEFHGAKDAPESLELWPTDYRIRLTFRLAERSLKLEAVVDNPDKKPLPFGLGYHPYFSVPLASGGKPEDCLVECKRADQFWELEGNLPTGKQLPVDAARDLTKPRPYSELNLDDVLRVAASADSTIELGRMKQQPGSAELRVRASKDYREVVVFTPPHRQAFCIEPYTCTTDAINLQAQGVDAGWRVLPPGGSWQGDVEIEVS
ncbi:MAG: aldose 1-epimerase [Gemmataceae bacterium]